MGKFFVVVGNNNQGKTGGTYTTNNQPKTKQITSLTNHNPKATT